MTESRTVTMVQEELAQAEARLVQVDAEVAAIWETIKEREEAYRQATMEQGELKILIASTRNDLATLQQRKVVENGNDADFDGCPKEWQREVIVFMRRQPGVQIHFTALVAHVIKKMDSEVFTKARAAMLNLMGHLISRKVVAKGKNGNYSWAVYPENFQKPAPVAPIMRVIQPPTLKLDSAREELASKYVDQIIAGREYIQKELEKEFHQVCIGKSLSLNNPDDFKNDAQFIEKWIYDRAQMNTGIISVYEKDPVSRKGGEVSTHLIISRMRASPGAPWVLVPNPTVAQPRVDTKRKGGSVA